MMISAEALVVAALALAVFSAITALGASLVFGIGYERLCAGFEVVRKQTAHFSDAIFKLEKRAGEQDKKIETLLGGAPQKTTRRKAGAKGKKSKKHDEDVPVGLGLHRGVPPSSMPACVSLWGGSGGDGSQSRQRRPLN